MSLEQIKSGIRQLDDSDFQAVRFWITEEVQRREAMPLAEKAKAEVVIELREKGALEAPDAAKQPPEKPEEVKTVPAWSDPGTDHARMYTKGDIVTHGGKVWQSEVDGLNSWEPGAEGVYDFIWRDITPAPVEPAKQPDGSKDNPLPFKAGLQLTAGQFVTYQGTTYRVIQGHTSADHWAPPDVASLFAKA